MDPVAPRDDLSVLVRRIKDLEDRIRDLERPTGTQRFQSVDKILTTVSYLESLKTYGATGIAIPETTIPNDGVFHYFEPSTPIVLTDIDIPTGRCVVEAFVGTGTVLTGGSTTIAGVTYELLDSVGTPVPGADRHNDAAGVVFSSGVTRLGTPVSTGPQYVQIDMEDHPGPYSLRFWAYGWSATANTTTTTGRWQDPGLRLDVIGSGQVFS